MALVIGKQYAKRDFGITPPAARQVDHNVGGELYSFFTMIGKMHNSIDADGFVYQVGHDYSLVPPGVQSSLHRHVFVRKAAGEEYTFLGAGRCEGRVSASHNKVFW